MVGTEGETDQLTDLVTFLTDVRSHIRRNASQIVAGLTGSPDSLELLVPKIPSLLPAILRNLSDPHEDISQMAASALVNLSQDHRFATALLGLRVTDRVMDAVREKTCPHHGLLMMLLCNVTTTDLGCEALLQLGRDKLEGLHLAVIMRLMMNSAAAAPVQGERLPMDEEGPGPAQDQYQHAALVLMNVTRLRRGRELMLQPGRGLLPVLAAQLRHPSVVRRRGSAGALRNCFLRAEEDGTLEAILEEREALKEAMHPISAKAPREPDEGVRESVAEAYYVLTCYPAARDVLWGMGCHEVLRAGYEFEENRVVCAAMERCIEIFMGDGAQKGEGGEGAGGEEEGGLIMMG